MPILFFFQPLSTSQKMCLPIFCHSVGASTLTWRHLVSLTLLSTFSKVASPSKPSISRDRADIHPWAPCAAKMFAMRFGLATSKAVLISRLATCIVGLFSPSVFRPCPMLLQQQRHHHLEMPGSSSFSHLKKQRGRMSRRHHGHERDRPVSADPFLWFGIWFSRDN